MTRFLRDDKAATLVEFAVTMPVLLILMFAILEFSALQMARIKVDKASYLIGNAITQLTRGEQKPTGQPSYFTIDGGQVDALLQRLDVMVPRGTRVGTKVVVSSFTYVNRVYPVGATVPQPVNAPVLLWAKGYLLGSNPEGSASTIPALGGNVAWGRGIQMQRVTFNDSQTQEAITRYGMFGCDENVVLVEVFYQYAPMFGLLPDMEFIAPRTLTSRAFMRPRTGAIEAVAGDASFNAPAATYQYTKTRGGFCN